MKKINFSLSSNPSVSSISFRKILRLKSFYFMWLFFLFLIIPSTMSICFASTYNPAQCDFTWSPDDVYVNAPTRLIDKSSKAEHISDFGALIEEYPIEGSSWNIPNIGQRFGEDVEVVFTEPGDYEIAHTVYTGGSCPSSNPACDPVSCTQTITVLPEQTQPGGTPPSAPTLLFPQNGATSVPLSTTLQTGSFFDPDSGDTHLRTEWQISSVSDFSSNELRVTSSVFLTSLTVPRLVLDEGTMYYWEARFQDSNGAWSEWSTTYFFMTITTTNDQNGNGIPDSQENNTVDMDKDGTPDSQQDHIKSLNTVVGNGQIGVSIKGVETVTSIRSIESIDQETISILSRPHSMPLGLIALKLEMTNPGDSAEITVYFSQAAPSDAVYYKYQSNYGWQDYSGHATFNGDRDSVKLYVQDGGPGDADGEANGVIVDPGGFGLASWINGYVSETATLMPIDFAEIGVGDLVLKTMTDGYFLSMILPGTYPFYVSAKGYYKIDEKITVPEGSIVTENFYLKACKFRDEKMYFPHIASGGDWETEIGIINTGSLDLSGQLRAYNNSGQLVDSKCIDLEPNARIEIVVGNEFSNPSEIGYIVLGSGSPNAKGYLKFYINGKYRVAIPAATDVNVWDIYVSHIASNDNWWTGVSLLNTTSSSKDLTINFDDGSTKKVTIAANEHKAFTVRELFNGNPQLSMNSAVIKNGDGIVGLEIFGSMSNSGTNYLSGILLKDESTTKIYYPHIASDSTWATGIVAYNTSTKSCDLTIIPYKDDGTILASQTVPLDGKEKYIGSPESLNLPAGTAWFTRNGNQLGGYTGVGISGTDGVFAKIDKEGGTGIAFVNIENSSAKVTITAYDDSGSVITIENISLRAYEKVVDVPSKLFLSDISTATYITYSSTGNVVGFQLNGSSDGMMLDALPGM